MNLEKDLESLERRLGHPFDGIEKLPGDASTRQYFRVYYNDQPSIVMKLEPFSTEKEDLSFLAIQRYLKQCGVSVPQILKAEPDLGMILVEDLGPDTLLHRLKKANSSDPERHLYEKAIDSLIQLQVFASQSKNPSSLGAFQVRFDEEKLGWEINYAIENFYQSYLKCQIHNQDLKTIRSQFQKICSILAEEPTVLCHRDFHSRNIMVVGPEERVVLIDFQDARMGPIQYDLASLLKDSYYQLEDAQIDRLSDYYLARFEGVSGNRIDRDHFRMIFDLMAVQRNFKAIGSFASFYTHRGDARYLKYIGNTFEAIRKTLLKYKEYSDLREALYHYYYF